ncbi:hypothetical protein WG954_07675 [Lacibacter sp. H375]|uniref:hypothetical protein n=1 Tax=Lacibacter sp. H375 TaxID=3133424 RepID=UPI0030BA3717
MQCRLIIPAIMFSLLSIGCGNSTARTEQNTAADSASFVIRFDKTMGDKDGFYLNGYIVPVPFNMIDSLHGKLIEVSGVITVHKGAEEYMKEQGEEVQARSGPSKHIMNPVIKIVSTESKAK